MIININKHEFSILWDGVYYKALSDYPHITDWELKSILDFIAYETLNHRISSIETSNQELLMKINDAIKNNTKYSKVTKPDFISECTACNHQGCFTEYLCHVASLDNARKIIESGRLLSARKARDLPVDVLMLEQRNAAGDPKDFFDYIMFSWGNCQAGDRLLMERKLGRAPTDDDLSTSFTPGIRFYFKYDQLKDHVGSTFDGYHALKIKDELLLDENVEAIVIPEIYKVLLEKKIPNALEDKVFYLKKEDENIWEWTEKIYEWIRIRVR